ncbi:MAG: hypothetical protein ABI586_06525 [Candidatus Nanopelagicales bacterium]
MLLRSWRGRLADEFGIVAVQPEALVGVDEIGRPVSPEAYSDDWRRLLVVAGVRSVSLHAARRSSVTAMRAAGEASCCGHSGGVVVPFLCHWRPVDALCVAVAGC